jgi:transmembrane sensor
MPPITEERLIALITSRIAGNLTEAEQAELSEWAEADPANRMFLSRMGDEAALVRELERWRNIDPSEGHAKWLMFMRAGQRNKILRMGSWVAAACVLMAFVGFWLVRRESPGGQAIISQAVSASSILPGRNTAVLTLADGRQILLDSAGSGNLAVQGKTRLVKRDSGSLVYDLSASGTEEEVAYNSLSTPRSGQYQLILPDGSHIWLNNASRIRYPVAFRGKDRMVELSGEAYFEIAKNPAQPFQVKVGGMIVDVLGTSFNIMAYADEGGINTTLLTGSVRVQQGSASVQLRPDEQAQVSTAGDMKVLRNVPAEDIVSWKNGFFYFGRASLKEVMRQLARWYDVDVEYSGAVPDQEFEGKIDRNLSLSDLLQFLNKNQVHFHLERRKIIVLPS